MHGCGWGGWLHKMQLRNGVALLCLKYGVQSTEYRVQSTDFCIVHHIQSKKLLLGNMAETGHRLPINVYCGASVPSTERQVMSISLISKQSMIHQWHSLLEVIPSNQLYLAHLFYLFSSLSILSLFYRKCLFLPSAFNFPN